MGGRTPFALLIYLTPPPPQLALPWGRAHTSLPHRYSRSRTTPPRTAGLEASVPASSTMSDYVQPAGRSPPQPTSEGGPTPTSFSMALLHFSLPQCDSVWPSSRVTVAVAAEGL
ncbi:hypothetical protein E2C01_027842 [Portunus trituberculatus]|uniref:Uncharacterized protein n=1 Tax=Portunus trituberculatus TaxID=210409 RepID=A0A5B7EIY6_PORTR|nr:hypothetical protein [Portunus trituberculatus]